MPPTVAANAAIPAWKVARDPFLAPVVARWGEAAAWDAGFFVDGATDDEPLDDVDRLCTPIDHLRRGLAERTGHGPPVVLVTTGA